MVNVANPGLRNADIDRLYPEANTTHSPEGVLAMNGGARGRLDTNPAHLHDLHKSMVDHGYNLPPITEILARRAQVTALEQSQGASASVPYAQTQSKSAGGGVQIGGDGRNKPSPGAPMPVFDSKL